MSDLNMDQTTIYIPFSADDVGGSPTPTLPVELERGADLFEGHDLRFQAYKTAWTKCLERIQLITRALLDPFVNQVVEEVREPSILPGLPYQELPVVTVTNPVFGDSFLNDVSESLRDPTVHLYPPDCPNLATGMRSLVSRFVESDEEISRAKHKSTTALASYDIGVLVAWYKQIQARSEATSSLVVVLHGFEEFDASVMQDMFYICSQNINHLPLRFILSLSSPLSSSYLHIAYPRSTVALLRIRNLAIPSGVSVLNEIVLKTFFSLEFEPDVVIGPMALEFICDFYVKHNSSLDSLLTNIQLVYMKHFSLEPLTVLVHSTPEIEVLRQPGFMDALLARLAPTSKTHSPDELRLQWSSLTLPSFSKLINEHRIAFHSRARGLRTGFGLMRVIQTFLSGEGYKGLGWKLEDGLCDILVDLMQDNMGRDIKELGLILRKLQPSQLECLLQNIYDFLSTLPQCDAEALLEVETLAKLLRQCRRSPNGENRLPRQISDWATAYLTSCLGPLEENPLWEVWYTGLSPFPSELINPSVRASIIAGLLRPTAFGDTREQAVDIECSENLHELPDISILFRRYLDSGRMINVYDWFESFQAVLEGQRAHFRKLEARQKKRPPKSPRKQSTKGKGKQKSVREEDAEEQEEEEVRNGGRWSEQTEEEWKIEVQARFVRALHELDYLGFIKHTKRKADHVVRTVFEVAE